MANKIFFFKALMTETQSSITNIRNVQILFFASPFLVVNGSFNSTPAVSYLTSIGIYPIADQSLSKKTPFA